MKRPKFASAEVWRSSGFGSVGGCGYYSECFSSSSAALFTTFRRVFLGRRVGVGGGAVPEGVRLSARFTTIYLTICPLCVFFFFNFTRGLHLGAGPRGRRLSVSARRARCRAPQLAVRGLLSGRRPSVRRSSRMFDFRQKTELILYVYFMPF